MRTAVIFLSTVSVCLTGCMTTPALPTQERPTHWGTLIHQQHNFYQVSPFLFRSEQPRQAFSPLLDQYQIHTIINLQYNENDDKLPQANQYRLIQIPIKTWKITRDDLLEVMKQLKLAQQRGETVLIHCYHGADRTGASIAMYRIIFEHWTIDDAVREMKHGGYGFHRIWKNIEQLFTEDNVKWIQDQLANK